MLNLKGITILLMAGLLVACGGSSSDKPLFDNSNNTDQSGGNDNGNDQTDGDISTGITIDKPRLGVGIGDTFQSGALELSLASISAGGSVRVQANIVDSENKNAQIVSQRYMVEFSSSCADNTKAEFSENKVTTSSGSVSTTYIAKGCVGDDTINAKLFTEGEELKHTAVAKLTVAAADVGAINFVETASPMLAIKKMANAVLPTNTAVTFQVVDKFGDPIIEKEVTFALQNGNGGVELARNNNVTDNNGLVSAIVNSGTAHTSFLVNATTLGTNGETISTSSQPISVTTGIPRQDRFSLSASSYNPASYDVDGVEVEITVRASDVFGNYVPEGTQVNFTTESGGMPGSCIIGEDGGCTVVWRSSGTRPGDYEGGFNLVNDYQGMTTIMAYTLGETGFTNKDAKNEFDIGDSFVSYAEPFRDDDWNQAFSSPAERFIDTNNDGQHSPAPSVYQGTLCSDDAKAAGHCDSLMHVRDQIRIVQTTNTNPVIRIYECSGTVCTENNTLSLKTDVVTDNSTTPPTQVTMLLDGDFYVVLQDRNQNMAPAGTILSVEGDGYDIFTDAGTVNNSIGQLDGTANARGFTGLPIFGMLYHVVYEPDTDPKSVTVKADNGGKITSARFKP